MNITFEYIYIVYSNNIIIQLINISKDLFQMKKINQKYKINFFFIYEKIFFEYDILFISILNKFQYKLYVIYKMHYIIK